MPRIQSRLYMNMGSGVGGGLVIEGVYHGDKPAKSRTAICDGSRRYHRGGPLSGWAVDRAIRDALSTHPESLLNTLCNDTPGGESKHLPEALAQNDPLAQDILTATTRQLAFALSHVTHLFHPQVITLGGGLSLIGVPLRKSIEQQLPEFLMDIYGNGPQIKLAELEEDAVPAGALLL